MNDFILNGEDDYTIYNFQPYLMVDEELNMADCYIYASNKNGEDDQLQWFVPGFKKVQFFPTTAVLNNSNDVIRLVGTEIISLNPCGHDYTPFDDNPFDNIKNDTSSKDTISNEISSYETSTNDTSSEDSSSDDNNPNSLSFSFYIKVKGLFMIFLFLT